MLSTLKQIENTEIIALLSDPGTWRSLDVDYIRPKLKEYGALFQFEETAGMDRNNTA